MTDTDWYTEASLSNDTHVFAAGSLAQCVRRWLRLNEQNRSHTQIRIGGRTGHCIHGLPILSPAQITELASRPELHKV